MFPQEEKSKLYDEALDRARQFSEHPLQENSADIVEYIFPELKESDERIKKDLIAIFKGQMTYTSAEDANRYIAWLEKQGEQKQQGKSTLESTKEVNVDNANKVEPKFRKGEWIACKELNTAKIINIYDDKYEVEFIDGNKGFPHIDYVDRYFYLWTIQDAKGGDVLAYSNGAFIYNGKISPTKEFCGAFCGILYGFALGDTECYWAYTEHVTPATKEQRDTLLKEMADAGYTFDFEKKELKKIVYPKFKCGDVMRTLQEANDNITSGLPVVISIDNEYYRCNNESVAIKDQDDYEYPPMNRTQKPAWIEEDERKFSDILALLRGGENCHYNTPVLSTWLKSLKDRVQYQSNWKPSEDQIEAIRLARSFVTDDFNERPTLSEILMELEEQLKKLRKG